MINTGVPSFAMDVFKKFVSFVCQKILTKVLQWQSKRIFHVFNGAGKTKIFTQKFIFIQFICLS